MSTKEIMTILIGGAVVAVVWWLLVSIPAFIGKARKLSRQHLKIIRLLAIFGTLLAFIMFAVNYAYGIVGDSEAIAVMLSVVWIVAVVIGSITWLVAIILSIVLSPEQMVRGVSLTYGDPIPKSKQERAAAASSATATAIATDDICENCGRPIGRLETPKVWKDHVVCPACYKSLRAA
jgi:hypothetical protein